MAQQPIMQQVQKKTDWSQQVILTDNLGRPIKSLYEGTKGSPFFIDDFKYSNIRLIAGKQYFNVPSRLNLYTHEVHFRSPEGLEMAAPFGVMLEAEFLDTLTDGSSRSYVFRTGYPNIDQQNEYHFYLVLAEGKVTLLKYIKRKINEERNELSGEVNKQFDNYEDYYIFRDAKMYRMKRDKSSYLDLLSDKKPELETYLKKEPVNFKKQEDISRFISYYNTL
jgi:hypothetical protein